MNVKHIILTMIVVLFIVSFSMLAGQQLSKEKPTICQDLFKLLENNTGIKFYPAIEEKMVSSYTESNFSWFPYDIQYEKGKLLTEDKLRGRVTCEVPVRYCDFKASEIGMVTNTTVRLCIDTVYVVLVDTTEQREWKYG